MKRILIADDVSGWRNFNSGAVREVLGDDIEIKTAECARQAYDILLENEPLYAILTDLQMEEDFMPKYAGEWLIEQIKTFPRYNNTKIILISASYNARNIAEMLGVNCIPKPTALKCLSAYRELLE